MNNKKQTKITHQTTINAKSVGVGVLDDPNSKGITLIALIITIIVMLILVAVTITVALDSGLFGTTKKAAYQTEVREVQEQLEIAKSVKVADNGGKEPSDYRISINDLSLSDELKNKYGSKLVISKDGTLYYDPAVVTDEEEQAWLEEIGISAYSGEEDADLAALEKYFLGEDKQGKNLMKLIASGSDPSEFTYKDDLDSDEDETELASNIHSLNFGATDAGEDDKGVYTLYQFYIMYNEKVYAVETRVTESEYLAKKVEFKYEKPEGSREGDPYLYDIDGDGEEEKCTILYDYGEGKGIEIVAPTVVGEDLTLGYGDTTINWEDEAVIAAADRDGDSTLSNLEKSIYSYNNAVKTINDYVKEQVTNSNIPKENIRSVGSNPDNPYSEYTTLYTSNNLANLNSTYNGVGKGADNNYEQDLIRMSFYGVANISDSYWLASRVVGEELGNVHFVVGSVNSDGIFDLDNLWSVDSSGSARGDSPSNGVRPVIKVSGV